MADAGCAARLSRRVVRPRAAPTEHGIYMLHRLRGLGLAVRVYVAKCNEVVARGNEGFALTADDAASAGG